MTIRTTKATDLEALAEAIEKHATKVPEGSDPVSLARALRRQALPLARYADGAYNTWGGASEGWGVA